MTRDMDAAALTTARWLTRGRRDGSSSWLAHTMRIGWRRAAALLKQIDAGG